MLPVCLLAALPFATTTATADGLMDNIKGLSDLANSAVGARDNFRNTKKQSGAASAALGSLSSVGSSNTNAAPGSAGKAAAGSEQLATVSQDSAAAARQIESDSMVWQADHCAFSQSQEITCYVAVLNRGADKRLFLAAGNVRLLTAEGTEYRASTGGFGSNLTPQSTLANGVSTPVTYKFRGIDPRTTGISRLVLFSSSRDSLTFQDVPMGAAGQTTSTTAVTSTTTTTTTVKPATTAAAATTVAPATPVTPVANGTAAPVSPAPATAVASLNKSQRSVHRPVPAASATR